jgi:tetratricopeptide (TPR) repeat protein
LARAADAEHADHETRVIALLMLGSYLAYAGRHEEAEARFRQGIEICVDAGDELHVAVAYVNRRLLWLRLNRLDEAESDLRRAVEVARRLGAAPLERMANLNLAETLYWKWDLEGALPLAERALALQSRFSGPDALEDDALLLARIHLARGDRASAQRARGSAGTPTIAKTRALARIVDLVLARSGLPRWEATEAVALAEASYAEIAIEFYLWATRAALSAGDRSKAEQWLARARQRAGDAPAWQGQISDLATHVGDS